jgi:hypothetical protein
MGIINKLQNLNNISPSDVTDVGTDDLNPSRFSDVSELPKQERKPLAYAAQGLLSNFTDAPGFFGMIGQGLETAADAVTDDKPITLNNIQDQWKEAGKKGIDAGLQSFSKDTTNTLAKIIGVDPIAKDSVNQAANIVGTFMLPTPTGKGSAFEKAFTFLTPMVRMGPKGNRLNKAFGIRAATQLGIGGGLDQGIRALIDKPNDLPLILSDNALAGGIDNQDMSPDRFSDPSVNMNDIHPDSVTALPDQTLGIPNPHPLKEAEEAQQDAANAETLKNWGIGAFALASGAIGYKYLKYIKQNSIPEQPFGTGPGPEKGQLAGAMDVLRQAPKEKGMFGALKPKAVGKLFANRAKIMVGNQVNPDYLFMQAARANGASEDTIEQIRGMNRVDAYGQYMAQVQHGLMPDGSVLKYSLRDLFNQYQAFDLPRQTQFLEYISAIAEDIQRSKALAKEVVSKNITSKSGTTLLDQGRQQYVQRRLEQTLKQFTLGSLEKNLKQYKEIIKTIRGTGKRTEIGLWKKDGSPTTDKELRAAIKAGDADPEFVFLRKELASYNKKILQDFAERGVGNKAWVNHTIKQFERDGVPFYIARQDADRLPGMFTRLAATFGFGTTEGKRMMTAGNLLRQSTEELKGINNPVGPWDSTGVYGVQMLAHTNRSVAQINQLKTILDMDFDLKGRAVFNNGGMSPADYAAFIAHQEKKYFIKMPEYIGRVSPTDELNAFGGLRIELGGSKAHLSDAAKAFQARLKKQYDDMRGTDEGIPQTSMASLGELENAVIVQRNGDYHLFRSTGSFKRALEMNQLDIGGVAQFNTRVKQIMTFGTTGRGSTFSFLSFTYNATIGSLNAALRSKGGLLNAGKEAVQVWTDGVKGATDILVTGIADDFAQMIGHTLRTGNGVLSSQPQLLKAMEQRLAKRVKQSMIHDANSKTGTIGSSSANITTAGGDLAESMSGSVMAIHKTYGINALPEFVRLWDHMNAALHEGVAWGATLRKLGGTTKDKSGRQIRVAQRQVADIVGDNTLRGASQFANQMNALIPFYAPMLQGLSTLSRSMAANGYKGIPKTLAKMTLVVGTPTLTEMLYNIFMEPGKEYPDASGRMWTHADWYLNGLTPEQRTANWYFPVPGKAPWKAQVFGNVPEISLLKGLYMDAFELTLDLANIPGITTTAPFDADHIAVGYSRALNIPYPTPIKAAMSLAGVDIRAGLETDPADGTTLFQMRSLAGANKMTPNLEQARYEGGEWEVKVKAAIQDLTGALGTTILKIGENLFGGDEDTPTSEKIQAGIDQVFDSIATGSKLYGGALDRRTMPAAVNHRISSLVYAKIEALNHFNIVGKGMSGGGMMSGENPKQGRTGVQTQDPVTQQLAISAAGILDMVAYDKKEISLWKQRINSLHHSLYNAFDDPNSPEIKKGPITIHERNELISSYRSRIDQHTKSMASILKTQEEVFAYNMNKASGRDMTGFAFNNWEDRPNP